MRMPGSSRSKSLVFRVISNALLRRAEAQMMGSGSLRVSIKQALSPENRQLLRLETKNPDSRLSLLDLAGLG